ncbi:MAG: hypothetical protein AB1453_01680 [Chloroflexota bacterium]
MPNLPGLYDLPSGSRTRRWDCIARLLTTSHILPANRENPILQPARASMY